MQSLYMLVLAVVLLLGYLLRCARRFRQWEIDDCAHADIMDDVPLDAARGFRPYESQLTAVHSAPPSASLAVVGLGIDGVVVSFISSARYLAQRARSMRGMLSPASAPVSA